MGPNTQGSTDETAVAGDDRLEKAANYVRESIRDALERKIEEAVEGRTGRTWVDFYAQVLGRDGVVRRMADSPARVREIESTELYRKLCQWLKGRVLAEDLDGMQTRMITVRVPPTVHDSLKLESSEKETSLNKLCVAKLLQPLLP
jgi:hypothetical protein